VCVSAGTQLIGELARCRYPYSW